MKNLAASCIAALFATAGAYAAPADDIAAAAAKLAAAPNYTFTSFTTFFDAPMGATPEYVAIEKGGATVAIARSGDGTIKPGAIQTVIVGEQMVMKVWGGAWQTMDERRAGSTFTGHAGVHSGAGVGGRRIRTGASGGQLNIVKDLNYFAAKIQHAKVVEGVIVGTLNPEEAARLLSPDRPAPGGQSPFSFKNASASVKFWLKDGEIAKYAISAKGVRLIPNGQKLEEDYTTTFEIKNVGTTKVVIPDEAKEKLGL